MMSTLRKMGMGHMGKCVTSADYISTEGESKMRNMRFSKGSFESSNLTIMNGSVGCVDDKENKGEETEAGNSSIDLVTPQCFFLSNKQSNKGSHLCTSVVPASSSSSSSSPSFSCASANNNSNNRNSASEEEVKPLRDNLDEYCNSQGQNNHHHHHQQQEHHSTRRPQQSKPLVLTHDQKKMKRRRRGNIRNSTIITINCRSILNGSCSIKSSFSFSSLLFGLMFTIASLIHSSHEQSFFSPSNDEWDSGSFRSGTYGNGYTCVNIPVNFTLCKNIGYNKMMIPNLLGHDSLQEAEFHAKSWVPLLGLQCHPDTQLFLCSLFSPICLDRPIYPCRSLCQGVQAKCEPRMLAYNYPWPSMLKCDQFPEDHDLCIRPGAANASKDSDLDCPSCNQAHTCENIVDNFCRADFVFRAKYKKSKGTLVEFRKERWFKPREGNRRGREFRTLSLDSKDDCCATKLRQGFPYIVMGIKRGDEYIVTFAMQWNPKDKILKNAVRTFRSMDCTNPLPMSVTAAGAKSGAERNGTSTGAGRRRRRKQGRRRDRQYGGCRVSAPGKNNN